MYPSLFIYLATGEHWVVSIFGYLNSDAVNICLQLFV